MQNIDPFEQVFDKGIDKNIAGQFCGDIQHLSIALYVIRFPLQLQLHSSEYMYSVFTWTLPWIPRKRTSIK